MKEDKKTIIYYSVPVCQPLPLSSCCLSGARGLGHGAKDRVVATDAGTMLIVILLCVTHFIKLGLREGEGREREMDL